MVPQPSVGIPDSPYLTADEAARYLRFPTVKAFYRWLETNPLPRCRRGKRVLLFERRVLDAFVRGDLWQVKKRRTA